MRWKGRHHVWGAWLPPGRDWSEFLSRQWEVKSRLHPLAGGLLFSFGEPKPWSTEQGAALPLIALDGGWSSFPTASPKPGEVVLRWQGATHRALLADLPNHDLTTLWDSSDLTYLRPAPPLIRPTIAIPRPPDPSVEVRDILRKIPPKAPEQRALLESPTTSPPETLGSFLKDLLRGRGSPAPTQPGQTDSPPSLWERIQNLWSGSGSEKEQYLGRVLKLFESEQWEQALRHAIPVLQTSTGYDSVLEHVGRLRPRNDLVYSARTGALSLAMFEARGREVLQETYRNSTRSLIAKGEIDYAAYVLAELLDDARAAVELLEQHERFEQAARLAELKKLPMAWQAALWYQAGESGKALTLARTHDIHAQVCQQLSSKGVPVIADRFRACWAEDLFRAGRSEEALTIGWPARRLLPSFEGWLLSAIDDGGATASQALAMAVKEPDLADRVDAAFHIKAWFSDHDPATWSRRRELLHQLAKSPPNRLPSGLTEWASDTARRLLKQSHGLFPLGGERELDYLVRLSEDPWLSADRPAVPRELQNQLGIWRQSFSRRGLLPLHDALSLGNGQFLLALGETGMMVVTSQGAVTEQFSQPAYRLITSPRSDLILVAGGHEFARFQHGRCIPWGFAEIDGFADTYLGFHWLVWQGKEIFAVDLSHPPDQPWSASAVYPLPNQPLRIIPGPLAFGVETELDTRCFSFPKGYQISIRPNDIDSDERFLLASEKNYRLTLKDGSYFFGSTRLAMSGELLEGSVRGSYGLVTTQDEEQISVGFFDLSRPNIQTVLEFPHARRVRVQVQGSVATVCDDQGRLVFVHLKSQKLLTELYL